MTSPSYLICIELSFLAESRRHVLGLYLLLGHVVLVLVEKMLVLNLTEGHMGVEDHSLCGQSLITDIKFHWQRDYLVGLYK